MKRLSLENFSSAFLACDVLALVDAVLKVVPPPAAIDEIHRIFVEFQKKGSAVIDVTHANEDELAVILSDAVSVTWDFFDGPTDKEKRQFRKCLDLQKLIASEPDGQSTYDTWIIETEEHEELTIVTGPLDLAIETAVNMPQFYFETHGYIRRRSSYTNRTFKV